MDPLKQAEACQATKDCFRQQARAASPPEKAAERRKTRLGWCDSEPQGAARYEVNRIVSTWCRKTLLACRTLAAWLLRVLYADMTLTEDGACPPALRRVGHELNPVRAN